MIDGQTWVAFYSQGPRGVRSWRCGGWLPPSSAGFCISFGSDEPLDILALFERANPRNAGGNPRARQQTKDEER